MDRAYLADYLDGDRGANKRYPGRNATAHYHGPTTRLEVNLRVNFLE